MRYVYSPKMKGNNSIVFILDFHKIDYLGISRFEKIELKRWSNVRNQFLTRHNAQILQKVLFVFSIICGDTHMINIAAYLSHCWYEWDKNQLNPVSLSATISNNGITNLIWGLSFFFLFYALFLFFSFC